MLRRKTKDEPEVRERLTRYVEHSGAAGRELGKVLAVTREWPTRAFARALRGTRWPS